MHIQTRLMLSVALGALAFAAAMPAAAEDAAAAPESAQTPVSELVVTGVRLQGLAEPIDAGPLGGKSILDTPFSVTVVDAEEIALRQPQTIGQLFINDPSVFSFASAGTVNWWGTQIRGLPVRNYYVDDVPLVLYWGGDYPLEPVESVQALKGATGFMYGFGAPGGAISYRTKRPTAEIEVSPQVGWRGLSVVTGQLDAGGPVTDELGVRLTLAGAMGQEYNEAEIARGLISLAADYAITPNLTWRTNATYEDYELRAEPFHIYWALPGGSALPSVPDDWGKLHIDNSYYRYETLTAKTALDWRISDAWTASLAYGYTRKRHHSNKAFIELNSDQGDYDAYYYQFGELDVTHFTQVMLQGEFSTGPIRHEVVLGAAHQVFESDFGSGYVYDYAYSGNIFQRPTYRMPSPVYDGIAGGPYEERQDSIFVSDTLYFGEHWQAIVGLRNTYYDLDDVDGDPLTASGYHTTALTPTVAVLYKPTPRATIYVSYVESLEGGQVVTPPYANAGEVFDATVSTQYEIGAKYDGERFSLTAAAFSMERALLSETGALPLLYLTQNGMVQYDGVEASGEVRVTDNLTLGGGAIHLDAQLEDGSRPAETSEWQVTGNFEYKVAAIEGLSLHGNVRYFGEAATTDGGTLIIPDYTLVGVGFQYRTTIGDRPVVFTGNINNLLNEQYWGLQNFGESINGSLGVKIDW